MNISKYEQRGFEGIDASLEISLCEYGLIWKEYKRNLPKRGIKKGEILAVSYDPGTDSMGYGYFEKSDLTNEPWIDYQSVSDFLGLSVDELKNLETGSLLFSLIGYYGKENFGFHAYG